MYIETKTVNNKMEVICLSKYDGKISKSFFLSNYKNVKDMIKNSILFLLKRKYNKYKIYFHNFF